MGRVGEEEGEGISFPRLQILVPRLDRGGEKDLGL
jgi:hypothetical protein